MKNLHLLAIITTFFLSASFVFISGADSSDPQERCRREIDRTGNGLPMGYNDLFAGSGECVLCHNSQVNAQDESVSIVADWRSSMMASSARDPFWQAKVSHETLVNPAHAEVLEDVCTRCHSPIGHFNAHHNGQTYYSIAEMKNDPLALDGASCTVCHQITSESLGFYSGELLIGTEKKIWGPYVDIFPNPMINNTGYTPEYGEQTFESELCATCHTLITHPVDMNGNLTGTDFVEQAVYQEWLNSDFNANDISCQQCHVPRIDDEVVISAMPPWLDPQSPFGMHHLAGANVFMLGLLKENIEFLGITATEEQLDSTISRAERLLKEQSLVSTLTEIDRSSDTLYVDLNLQNIAGHKFPTSYPSRRIFVELYIIDVSGDTLFHSGEMDEDFNLVNEDPTFEPHYNIINNESQVQIYEMVMGNVNYEVTTVLERAYIHLKDNRIPPQGFTTGHISYDTAAIVGEAIDDPDFNWFNQQQGTGKDILHFHIPLNGNNEEISVNARVYYQTVTEKWLQDMFTYTSEDIDKFRQLFYDADRNPVLVAENSLQVLPVSLNEERLSSPEIYPNPAGYFVNVKHIKKLQSAQFFDISGAIIEARVRINKSDEVYRIELPEKSGMYLLYLQDEEGAHYTSKILVKN